MISKLFKQIGKPLLGIGLLVLIYRQLDAAALGTLVDRFDAAWFALGFTALVISNLFSAYRWSKIAAMLGSEIPVPSAIRLYAQGITANTVLPGGIVGGDVWRTIGLVKRGANKSTAALSVLFDRVSGVWVLGICSLAAIALAWMIQKIPPTVNGVELAFYSLGLACLAVAPLLLKLFRQKKSAVILRTLGVSLLVQCFAFIAFWACFRALGQSLPLLPFVAVSAGIFVSAVIPAAIGGFGARELGAVVFMAPLGIAAETSFAASVLYGLMATLQGMLAVVWWVSREK